MKRIWILFSALALLFIGASSWAPAVSEAENPTYQIEQSDNEYEVRLYDPMMIAHIAITGTRQSSISKGFKKLAEYIFSGNLNSEEIPMTAPVFHKKVDNNNWQISFFMPSKYTSSTIPKPKNKNIRLENLVNKKFVTIKFSGTDSEENIISHEKKLRQYIAQNKLEHIEPAIYAFFNPPWTLPFMRKNEVMFEIR